MVRDPQSGKYRRTRLFVMTLGYSRKAVRLLTFRSSSRIRAELHEKAFRRLGSSTRIVVLDNLKEGVLVPDIYDPSLNHSIAMCSPTTVVWPCLAGSRILIAKDESNPPSATRREHRSRENALRVWKRPKPIWIALLFLQPCSKCVLHVPVPMRNQFLNFLYVKQ